MESVVDVLARKRGRATFAELVEATSRRALAAAVKGGAVQRLARGIYVLPGPLADTSAAFAYNGVVSHLSAAVAWDLPLLVHPEKRLAGDRRDRRVRATGLGRGRRLPRAR